MSSLSCSVSPGVKIGIFPSGMFRFVARSNTSRKTFSPVDHDIGAERLLKACSVSFVNYRLFAFLNLVEQEGTDWGDTEKPFVQIKDDGWIVRVECCFWFPASIDAQVKICDCYVWRWWRAVGGLPCGRVLVYYYQRGVVTSIDNFRSTVRCPFVKGDIVPWGVSCIKVSHY